MSRTHKHQLKIRYKKLSRWMRNNPYEANIWHNQWHDLYEKTFTKEEQLSIVNYTKNSSKWNHLYNNKPKKREASMKLKQIDLHNLDQDLIFPDDHKPCKWEW
jgi:hypothetical protein